MLHASVTLFGTRSVEVRCEDSQVTLLQQPGSFYVGNLAALEHNVRHHEECEHTFDGAAAAAKVAGRGSASAASDEGHVGDPVSAATAEGDPRMQIAIMIRCDVFRDSRARKINSIPGPAELFRVVNYVAAAQLAEVPLALPDLTEVLAEMDRSAVVRDGLGDATPTSG